MSVKKDFGKKIKKMRVSRKLTQEELSEAVNISQRALSAIETGENFVTAETLEKLLTALDTTTDELFALESIKDTSILLEEIQKNIDKISKNHEKIEIVYKFLKSMLEE